MITFYILENPAFRKSLKSDAVSYFRGVYLKIKHYLQLFAGSTTIADVTARVLELSQEESDWWWRVAPRLVGNCAHKTDRELLICGKLDFFFILFKIGRT